MAERLSGCRWGLAAAATLAVALPANRVLARSAAVVCDPAVLVRGDSEDASRIAEALRRIQIDTQSAPGCPVWSVTPSRAGTQVVLQIADGHGLTLVRRVSSADVAAAVIDSWVRHDLANVAADQPPGRSGTNPALTVAVVVHPRRERALPRRIEPSGPSRAGRRRWIVASSAEPLAATGTVTAESLAAAPPADSPSGAAPRRVVDDELPGETSRPPTNAGDPTAASDATPVVARAALPAGVPRERGPFSVALGTEASVGADASRWWGGRLAVCATMGRLCVGMLARADRSTVPPLDEPGTVDRVATDLLATVSLPIPLGRRLILIPEAGVGVGRLVSTATLKSSDPSDLTATEDPVETVAWGLRATARVVLSIPVWWRLAVDVSTSLDTSFARRVTQDDGEGSVPLEPRVFLRGGIALRYGAP